MEYQQMTVMNVPPDEALLHALESNQEKCIILMVCDEFFKKFTKCDNVMRGYWGGCTYDEPDGCEVYTIYNKNTQDKGRKRVGTATFIFLKGVWILETFSGSGIKYSSREKIKAEQIILLE